VNLRPWETCRQYLFSAAHFPVLRRERPKATENKIAKQLTTNNVLYKSVAPNFN